MIQALNDNPQDEEAIRQHISQQYYPTTNEQPTEQPQEATPEAPKTQEELDQEAESKEFRFGKLDPAFSAEDIQNS